MVRDANGRIQAIVGDIPGLLCVKCVGRCFSGNLYELQFLNRRKTAWFAIQVLYWTINEDIIQWSFLCFQFQSSDNSSQVFRNLQTGERMLDGEIFFQNFLDRTADFYQSLYGFIYIYLLFLLNYWFQIRSHFSATQHWSVGFPVMWSVFSLQPSPFNHFPQIRDSWHDLVLFRIVSRMFFFFFFLTSFPKRFNNSMHEE